MTSPSTSSLEGLCLGGPLDGKTRSTQNGPYLRARVQRVMSIGPADVPDTPEMARYVEYGFHELYTTTGPSDTERYGFWVPTTEEFPQRYILRTLMAGYKGETINDR